MLACVCGAVTALVTETALAPALEQSATAAVMVPVV
jgi:hypothetical protein